MITGAMMEINPRQPSSIMYLRLPFRGCSSGLVSAVDREEETVKKKRKRKTARKTAEDQQKARRIIKT